ncbi:hypothetical protein Mal4_55990 [Maioricimonas rarisocia]|uniref:Uncharacterized protein n=1 Tax=Maioricimonas rarisocia TaxID=2528026 RepID=A0A517ZFK1_9PLAN|nr:hypothetical protein [Maioricimonas rarisocia]QDU41234.1 hypothetical protein Mal4_55990 [Maioricimonas rarisocia]
MPQNPTPAERQLSVTRRRNAVLVLLMLWTFLYNVLIKQQEPLAAFFGILDTVSDDFVMGALLTVTLGSLIVVVFGLTKLYTQMIANVHSFRILETIVYEDLCGGRVRAGLGRLLNLQDQPLPEKICPLRPSSIVFCSGLIYAMSWIYVILFSEALFFVSWSAGVDLPVNEKNVLLLPTLALAIPFSARVMAYLRYPYAQDYADFMPGALFVLLLVAALGYLFGSPDQEFFLLRVTRNEDYLFSLLTNGVFLAFIPVFFELMFWMFELGRDADPGDPAAASVGEDTARSPSG